MCCFGDLRSVFWFSFRLQLFLQLLFGGCYAPDTQSVKSHDLSKWSWPSTLRDACAYFITVGSGCDLETFWEDWGNQMIGEYGKHRVNSGNSGNWVWPGNIFAGGYRKPRIGQQEKHGVHCGNWGNWVWPRNYFERGYGNPGIG